MSSDHEDLVRKNQDFNQDFTLATWTSQKAWNPISMTRAEGVYFWDADGKRYIDWSSQLFNVNIGHGHPHVNKAVKDQIERISFAYPGIATRPRAELAELLTEITPGDLQKTFFTLGGADAVENAMKLARLYAGRQKVLSRYRSYHGATFGALTAGGDPRGTANEPGVPWIVHIHDPYSYRSPIYRNRSQDEGDRVLVDLIETFWRGIQEICDRYGIMLIIDEVLSGFGRTGKWFGIDHYPFVRPDIFVMAKGLTSGYVPLGAVMVNKPIAEHFDENTLWAGLTYGAHPLGCAAGVATIEVYKEENLIEKSMEMGKALRRGLLDLAENHPSVGDVRGTGLHQVIELVKNKDGREPMSGWNRPLNEPMQRVARSLRESGMSTFVKWDWVFCAPPLVVNEEQIGEGLAMIEEALKIADTYCTD
jgi:taurine--2-oxoglutarate transaminase